MVGFGVVNLMGGPVRITIEDFARTMVSAAAALGPQRVAQLVFGWIRGEPLRYQTNALLIGVTIDQSLALEEGINLTQMPSSSEHLPAHLLPQRGLFPGEFLSDFLGRVVLSIDCEANPAFYKPTGDLPYLAPPTICWAQGKIPGISRDMFCTALSLSCNHSIRWQMKWEDYGELHEFNPGHVSGPLSQEVSNRLVPTTSLSRRHLDRARDLQCARHVNGKMRARLETAISRWMESKKPVNLLDQLIDLRIALEALYLKGAFGEMRFRLSTYGAWHLAADVAERRKYQKVLLKIYDLASKAVHGVDVKNTSENRALLETAQDLCRNAIVKRIEEEREPDLESAVVGKRFLTRPRCIFNFAATRVKSLDERIMITANVIQRTFFVKIGSSLGTAFTIDHDSKQYLVTARHVVGSAVQSIEVFHNTRWESLGVTPVGIGQGAVDVAVFAPNIILSPPHPLEATSAGLTYGQPVSFLGFPFGWEGGLAHMNNGFPLPFVKAGILSAMPPGRRFWIDAHGNRGFSGGPVVFQPAPRSDNSPWKVAGIVTQAGLDPMTHENAGFVIAESIASVTDIIAQRPIGPATFGPTFPGNAP